MSGMDIRRKLKLLDRGITSLDGLGTIESKNSFNEIDLAYNAITSIPENIFQGFTKVDKLELSHNQISTISWYAFYDLKSLDELDLSYNNLKNLPDSLEDIELDNLNLSNNKIGGLPDGFFAGFKKVRVIDLSNNQLRDPSVELFSPLKDGGIAWLNLSGNEIDEQKIVAIAQALGMKRDDSGKKGREGLLLRVWMI